MKRVNIPLYDRGSLGSTVLAFGTGHIIDLPHCLGINPVSKQTLNKICRNDTAESFFNTSTGIRSTPKAFPRLACLMAFCTSKI